MRILRPECSECFVEQSRVLLVFLARAEAHPRVPACLPHVSRIRQSRIWSWGKELPMTEFQ